MVTGNVKEFKFHLASKKISALIVILVSIILPVYIGGEALSQIGPVDEESMKTICGFWVLDDTRVAHRYTNEFVCLIDGLKYFRYNRVGTNPGLPYVFTIVKSKKTGRFYFARGYYKDGRLYGSTSRMEFKNKDHFVVYEEKNPEVIFFEAHRAQVKNKPR